MITISRKKDLTDLFAAYKYSINNEQKNLKAGEQITTELNETTAYFQVQFLYFKSQKILLHKDLNTTIKVGSCIENKMVYFVMPIVIIGFLIMSFTDLEWALLTEVTKYLALFYFFVLIYFSTFGYKNYIQVEVEYQKT